MRVELRLSIAGPADTFWAWFTRSLVEVLIRYTSMKLSMSLVFSHLILIEQRVRVF